MMIKKHRLIILSVFSGILLTLPWWQSFSGIILLVAFVPLLFVEEFIFIKRDQFKPVYVFGYGFLAFFLWNILSVYWIFKVTLPGALFVMTANSLLMALIFFLYHLTKRNLGRNFGNFSLMAYWLGWEYFMFHAELAFPWLTLGNGFAKDISLVQWYEFTGTLGGSLWVLSVNLLVFAILRHYIVHRTFGYQVTRMVFTFLMIFVPILVSLYQFKNYREPGDPVQLVVVQPNIDPIHEKYDGLTQEQQISRVLHLGHSRVDSTTDYLVAPETVIHEDLWQERMHEHPSIRKMQQFVCQYPGLHVIFGVDIRRILGEDEAIPAEAKKQKDGRYFMRYNAALQLDSTGQIPVYYKSRLVNGIEKVPYPKLFGFLNDWLLDLGDETGSLGTQDQREIFKDGTKIKGVAPVICYESVFGEFVTRYVRNGAELIVIITNDGWFGDTAGYKQHLHFARLRAVETRRGIARSANTGISALINQKGELIKTTDWWTEGAIKGTLNAFDGLTFYVQYGNYIGRIASFLAVFGLLYLVAKMLMRSSKNADLLKLR